MCKAEITGAYTMFLDGKETLGYDCGVFTINGAPIAQQSENVADFNYMDSLCSAYEDLREFLKKQEQ